MDKLYYKALTEHLSDVNREDLGIQLTLDKEARTLTITDNGIGMTKDELENNLGAVSYTHLVPEDGFVHIDIPLTLEHQLELMGNAGFRKAKVLYQNEGTMVIRAEK